MSIHAGLLAVRVPQGWFVTCTSRFSRCSRANWSLATVEADHLLVEAQPRWDSAP